MSEYLSPGVYVEEFEMGAKPIEGVSTSTAGFLGETERGPTKPKLITSWLQFQRVYGSYFGSNNYLPYAVEGFFNNGGQRCYIAKVVGSGAASASVKLAEATGAAALTVEAVGEGTWGNKLVVKVSAGTFGGFKLSVFYWKNGVPDPYYDPEIDRKTRPRPSVEEVYDNLSVEASSSDYYGKKVNGISSLVTITKETGDTGALPALHTGKVQAAQNAAITLAAGASADDDIYNGMTIRIVGGTGEGQTRTVRAYAGATKEAVVDRSWETLPKNDSEYIVIETVAQQGSAKSGSATAIALSDAASAVDDFYNDMYVEIVGGSGSGQILKVTDYDGGTKTATVSGWTEHPDATSVYRMLTVAENGEGTAAADGTNATVTLDAAASGTDDAYAQYSCCVTEGGGKGQTRTIISYAGASKIATVEKSWDAGDMPAAGSSYSLCCAVLEGGTDGTAIVLADYTRTDSDVPGKRRGLTAFGEIDEISIVYAPNAQAVTGLVGSLVDHCEIHLKDRFAVIDAEQGASSISDLKPRDGNDTSYAAFYYPWIEIVDPGTGMIRLVPPGGHMAGIYARSDTERGVHKAPANEPVRGAVGLEFAIGKGEQDILNPRGVNCIRAFPGRGIRVWGARTLSSDPAWKYVNIRRLFLYLEESIDEGTQWVVFEPNSELLWARVRQTITNFLTRVWKDGALMGMTAEEAFFVKCDRSTMTQDDIDNGRLVCVIGVAPVKPAEFVIFRIAQWTGDSETAQ